MGNRTGSHTPTPPSPPSPGTIEADVAVVGGGVIGHGIAWEVSRSGRSVVLIDDAPGSGASWAAAGMLAPVSELHYQEEDLLELMLDAAARWPEFAGDLAAAAGRTAGYLTTPTLAVGADAADRQALMDLRSVQQASGLTVEPLPIREARRREPLLSPAIACALDTPADHQVDPRLLLTCLRRALADHGSGDGGPATRVAGAVDGFAIADRVAALVWQGDAVAGVRLAGGGAVLAGETVVANGLHAADVGGLPPGLRLPLRPVHGDILRLAVPRHLQPLVTATVRGMVHGVPVYIVPREDGTVVIGATQREDSLGGSHLREHSSAASSDAVSAGGVYQLLRDAQVLVPAVAELELLESTARARPATPDNAPLLGRVPLPGTPEEKPRHVPGLIIATGFFRHGVLLTPAAAAICRGLLDGVEDQRWAPFNPSRFSGRGSGTIDVNTKETV